MKLVRCGGDPMVTCIITKDCPDILVVYYYAVMLFIYSEAIVILNKKALKI